jgi:hypothetical protein
VIDAFFAPDLIDSRCGFASFVPHRKPYASSLARGYRTPKSFFPRTLRFFFYPFCRHKSCAWPQRYQVLYVEQYQARIPSSRKFDSQAHSTKGCWRAINSDQKLHSRPAFSDFPQEVISESENSKVKAEHA